MIQRKVCLLGAFAVGKTSLVSRFVHGFFSDRYHTTVGVKIDKKLLAVDGEDVQLIVWDLAGEDDLVPLRTSYLRGASGCLVVVDGTRGETLDVARDLCQRVKSAVDDCEIVFVLNKSDLKGEWELASDVRETLTADGYDSVVSSAKSGDGVEAAFAILAKRMLSRRP